MNDYLIDRETLGQFVDALISQKSQIQPAANSETRETKTREDLMAEVDDLILDTVIRSLNRSQFDEFNALLDRGETDATVFENFFKNANLDLTKIVTETLKTYQTEFLGGENAE